MENKTSKQIVIFIIIVSLISIFVFIRYALSLDTNDKMKNDFSDKITYTATFKLNGASYIEKNEVSCEVNNNLCLITMPIALRDNGDVLGYSTSSDETKAVYNINQQINLTSNQTFYVISRRILNLKIIDNNIDYLGNDNNYCTIYNKETSCSILIPIYNKIGYEVRGYSTNKSSLVGFVFPNSNYEIKRDTTLYPIYSSLTRGKIIDVERTTMIDNTIFDIEKGCPVSIYSHYLNYFEKISQKAPYLMIGSKVSFLTDESFDKIWGRDYVGMNYGPKGLRLFDVRCSNSLVNNYYATIVHELAHTWDFYYSNFMDNDVTDESDVINLYNKYMNMSSRPFRDYSYTDIREFFADMVRYYYLKYIDPTSNYQNLSYPSDIRFVLEKYICIANNNYDENKC